MPRQKTSKRVRTVGRLPLFALAVIMSGGCSLSGPESESGAESAAVFYVQAGAVRGGDGSLKSPFADLARAEEVAPAGATIHLLPALGEAVLDGGIALRPHQKLIGLRANGAQADAPTVRVTNSTDNQGGVIVRLATGNEVSGIRFERLRGHGILGLETDVTGTHIHHNSFTNATLTEARSQNPDPLGSDIVWAIRLSTASGQVTGVNIYDNQVTEGARLGGIQVVTSGSATGRYRFERNTFSDLGGRAYHLWSQDASYLEAEIIDSSANNIGLGGRNSDSILPHLSHRSKQKVVVRNFHYRNTRQVGSPSNCGIEAFIKGAPFPEPESHCNGCQLDLLIADSLIEDAVTDGIQLINFGSNSIFNVAIRGSRILRAKPQQVGGGISLLAQNPENRGSRSALLVEDTDIIGSSRFGVAVVDTGDGHTSTVDLGGGVLGSTGNNRIIDSAEGEMLVEQAMPVARNNWWGRPVPRITRAGERSTVDWEPVLASNPAR